MTAETRSLSVPLRQDQDGVLRVGETRITLDTVIAAFNQGATPEEISQAYPTVALVDLYTVIGYYLRYRAEVEMYLQQRAADAERLRRQIEARPDTQELRQRLLARRAAP